MDKGFVIAFQSTRPVRGATPAEVYCTFSYMDFNPRAPCGARLYLPLGENPLALFQSTRPVRGATRFGHGGLSHGRISIHAPRAGRDYAKIADDMQG